MSSRLQCGATMRSLALVLSLLAAVSVANVAESSNVGNAEPSAVLVEAGSTASSFALTRYVIAAGGGYSSGGVFALQGTIGQLDADPLHPATGGVYAISGGFWPGLLPTTPNVDPIFANGFEPLPP